MHMKHIDEPAEVIDQPKLAAEPLPDIDTLLTGQKLKPVDGPGPQGRPWALDEKCLRRPVAEDDSRALCVYCSTDEVGVLLSQRPDRPAVTFVRFKCPRCFYFVETLKPVIKGALLRQMDRRNGKKDLTADFPGAGMCHDGRTGMPDGT